MIEVLPDNVGPSSTLSVPRSRVSDTSRMVATPSTVRVTWSSVTLMAALPLRAADARRSRDAPPSSRRAPAISAGVRRRPSLERRHTTSSARHRPFVRHQVSHLGFGERITEGLSEIGHRFRAAEQLCRTRAVGVREPVGVRMRQERMIAHQFRGQRDHGGDIHVAAGQRRGRGPAFLGLGAVQIRRKPLQRLLGKAAIGRDLAAIDRQQRRAAGRIELEHVVARGGLGFAGAVVIERTHAGVIPDHVGRLDGLCQIFADGVAEIFDLFRWSPSPWRDRRHNRGRWCRSA